MTVELKLGHLGISLVEERPQPQELLYMQFELLRMEWSRDSKGMQQVGLAISEAQVNCQGDGRVDARTCDSRRQEALAIFKQERPAVIATNTAEGDRAFFRMALKRGATSSRDIWLPHAEVAMDAVDITIDDGWLDPLVEFLKQASIIKRDTGVLFSHIAKTAGKPIVTDYSPPLMPTILQVDSLKISQVCLTIWCVLKLKSLTFLSETWRHAIQVLSLSNILKLDGATLNLPEKKVPTHRGSLNDFMRGLMSEYSRNLLGQTANVLGKSSLLKLPRVPLKLGGTAFAYMSDSAGLLAGETASILNSLAFDDEYVSRQRAIRESKQIGNLGDGVVEAGKSLALGVEGMLDIVNKPAEGLRTGGFGGFLSGVGKGAVNAFVKPLSGMGQAMSDVGAGVASTFTPDTVVMKRRRNRFRTREPRMLYTHLSVLRPWSAFDADVQSQMGRKWAYGLCEAIPLTETQTCRTLLLYSTRLLTADIQQMDKPEQSRSASQSSSAPARRSTTGAASAGSAKSSSAKYPENNSPDLADAVDESALKLYSQVLKPLNTIVYGWQDMQGQASEAAEAQATDAERMKRLNVKEFRFRELEDVSLQSHALVLHVKKGAIQLPLGILSQACRQALVTGLKSALIEGRRGVANWDDLHRVLSLERQAQGDASSDGTDSSVTKTGAGQRTLEVFECERYQHIGNCWKTPFTPLDTESCWRWVDASGNRHPHLIAGPCEILSDRQRFKEPPCELDKMFKPKSRWSIDVHQGTDREGWRYALAWNSSTWDSKPGFFDAVRKRRWTRIYS